MTSCFLYYDAAYIVYMCVFIFSHLFILCCIPHGKHGLQSLDNTALVNRSHVLKTPNKILFFLRSYKTIISKGGNIGK